MLLRNILLTLRRLKSREKYVWLNILSAIVGISAFLCIVLYVYNEFSVDSHYKNSDYTFRILENNANSGIDYELNQILLNDYPEIKDATVVYLSSEYEFSLETASQQFITKSFISTDNRFFEIFDIVPIEKSSSELLPTESSIILTPSSAASLFGDENALGQKIGFMGKTLTVSAIIPEFSSNSSMHADFIVNIRNQRLRFHRGFRNKKMVNLHNHYIVTNDNTDPVQLATKINETLSDDLQTVEHISLQPLKSLYLSEGIDLSRNRQGNKMTLYTLMSIAIVILLLSIINKLQLSISYYYSNFKSIGLQIFNGASKRQIFIQYLVENLVLLTLVFIASVSLLMICHPWLNTIFINSIDLSNLFSWQVISITAFTFLLMVVLGGYLPIFVLSKAGIKNLLSKKVIQQKSTLKQALPIVQFAITIVLLICALTIHKQLNYTKSHNLGFDKQHLLQLSDNDGFKNSDVLKQKMKELSFVQSSSRSYGAPAFINVIHSSKTGDDILGIGVDEDFLKTFDIELLEGREFQPGEEEKVCYINEAFLKFKNWSGKQDYLNQEIGGYRIIGLVNNFSSGSLHQFVKPTFLYYSNSTIYLNLRLSEGNLPIQMSKIEKVWKEVYPDDFFNYKFYDSVFDEMYKREENLGMAINLFTILTFFITGMGLLGLVMQITISTTKEIGIRKVNGAKISEILTLLNKDFIKWVVIAFVIATPIAWYAMDQWLNSFAYKTELNWWIFALAGFLALAIALLTVSWQSWKAASRNPVEALRYE